MSTVPYENRFKDHQTGMGPKAAWSPDEWIEPHYKVLQRVEQKLPIVFLKHTSKNAGLN
jgi:hypothetical protein